jgi:hypothetical protein
VPQPILTEDEYKVFMGPSMEALMLLKKDGGFGT